MKLRVLIVFSLVLNLLLMGGVVWRLSHRTAPVEKRGGRSIPPRTVRVGYVTNAANTERVEVKAPFHWSEVESADYRVYIANLRAIGCPEKTIRDIIEADLDDLFAGKVKKMVDGVTGRFWEFVTKRGVMGKLLSEKQAELESLKSQRAEIARELFGGTGENEERNRMRQFESELQKEAALDFLPADKIGAVAECEARFQSALAEFEHANSQTPYEVRQAKYSDLLKTKQSEIEALLTPAEWEEYRLRTSSASNERLRLADFEITSDQMREIVRAGLGTNRGDAVKSVLGPEQAAAYQRSLDEQYHLALKVTDRFNLPQETAVQVYAMQSEVTARATEIRHDTSRSIEDRRAILQAIKAEAERSMSAALGAKAFKAYQVNAGEWFPTIPPNSQ